MNILVIPEDFRKDQYMLKPIISAMLAKLEKPRAKVKVCQDPLLGGVNEALKWERIEEIIDQYRGMFNLFLLCVDRDGKVGRKATLDDIMLIFSTTLVQRGAKAPTTNRLQSS